VTSVGLAEQLVVDRVSVRYGGVLALDAVSLEVPPATVVGLIGERGREVQDFVSNTLGPDGMRRAVVVATPADNPDSTRPTSRSSTPVAPRNAMALPIANAVARNNIGRRPTASDQRPNTSSAASTPPAYVANTTVVVRTEKCICSE